VIPDGLLEAFRAYEQALAADDVRALAGFFEEGPEVVRVDGAGVLAGSEQIARFRIRRGGAGARRVVDVRVLPVDVDQALVVSVNAPATGGRGAVTQLWRRVDGRWRIRAAHVQAPAPALDRRTWRVVGSPLVAGAATGPLAGHTVAVKDLFAVAGFPVGAGNPDFLAAAPAATEHADAVAALLLAGASVTGIAQTDEFAYSLAGRNAHTGTPPNPRVPGALPGGSSSGPASAVASGQASIGLATDTAGSIRVPASYQGLWGLRTTHGAVSRRGLLPLAPSFDTVGWLTRDAATLRAAAGACLTGAVEPAPGLVVDPALLALADPAVRSAFCTALTTALGELDGELDGDTLPAVSVGNTDELAGRLRTVQGAEAWRSHGRWTIEHPGSLGADVAARFAAAGAITPDQEAAARAALGHARTALDDVLAGRVLVLPSAPTPAPPLAVAADELDAVRARTLRLTCVAGVGGYPAVSVPVLAVDGAPVGMCLVGPRGSDLALVDLAARLAERLGTR
jgi:Asp-tRNA(Asn)/Glu-tRNA(Gln) amidotransferase A subunit family amidase